MLCTREWDRRGHFGLEHANVRTLSQRFICQCKGPINTNESIQSKDLVSRCSTIKDIPIQGEKLISIVRRYQRMMTDWEWTGKIYTQKNKTMNNLIVSDAIITQIPGRQDVPEEAVGRDVGFLHNVWPNKVLRWKYICSILLQWDLICRDISHV